MWGLMLLLGFMIVKTDHGCIPDGIYNEHSLSNSPSIWTVKSDTKVLSSVINSHISQTLYYTSETTVTTLYPLQSLNNDSLGPFSNSIWRDSTREALDSGRGNALNEDSEKGLERRIVEYVWVFSGLAASLIAAVALGFKLGRKSVKSKSKQIQISTTSSDEDARISAPIALSLPEEVFKVQSDNEIFVSISQETSSIFSASAAPRGKEEVKKFSVDCKHDRKSSLLIETEGISPIQTKWMKPITDKISKPITFEEFGKDESLSDSYGDSDSEDSYSSSKSEEENQHNSLVPYKRNICYNQDQVNYLNISEEKKHEFIKEKIPINDLQDYEKSTEIESEVRFERTDNPQAYEKVETHVIRTTYLNTKEVESYFDKIEKCNKPVLAVYGTKDHATEKVSLEAHPCSSPSISGLKLKKQPLQLEFHELESSSEGEEAENEVDVIEFKRSVSKSSENIVPRESLDPDFKELFEVLDDGNYSKQFVVEKLLGQGAFGAVYLVRSK
jgi:hypothetical protein